MEKIDALAFEKAIIADKKIVIKFYVDWCPDCRRSNEFDKRIEECFSEYFTFYCINADEQPELRDKNAVRGFPSYLIYKKGIKSAHLHSKWAKTFEQVSDFLTKNISEDFTLN